MVVKTIMTITIALSAIVLQEEDDEGDEEGDGCFQSKCPGDSPVVVDEMHEEEERDACPQQSSPLVNRFFA